MRRTLTVLALMVLLGQSSLGQSREGISDLAAGEKAARTGHYQEAIPALDKAIAAFRSSPKLKGALAEAYVHLGMAQVGLGREGEARESFRRALRADNGLVLKRTEFSARVLDLFQSVGGRVEAPPRATRKKPIVPWIVGGLVGVGAPVVAIATNKDPVEPTDTWAAQRTDDDGDGLSEEQGDCNDADPATKPDGKTETHFSFLMDGGVEVNCAHPYEGTEQITVTNHSCTTEWVSVFRTGTYLRVRPSGYVTTDLMIPWANSVAIAPGATATLYSRDSRPLTSDLSYGRPDCPKAPTTFHYTETFTVRSSQGEEQQTRTYTYSTLTCPACGT